MEKIWAFVEHELISYLEKIENATPEEIKAAENIFSDKPLPEILTIEGDTAKIRITGPLTMRGPSPIARFFRLGGTGYVQILEAIEAIPENIKKVELLMNTPGGEVLGVDNVWQAVNALSEKKEVTAINQGLIASAGYWIASASDKIISESPVNLNGSIGVVIIAIDTKKLEERIGIRVVTVVSRNAPKKAPDVSKKSGIQTLQEVADSIERVFISRISEGRNLPIDHIEKYYGRGNVLVSLDPDGTDAIDVKMIDEVITAKYDEDEEEECELHGPMTGIENEDFASYIKDTGNESINGIPAIEELNPVGPFANEHAARLLSPTISKIRVRRTSGSGRGTVQGVKIPESIDIIWFIQRSGNREVPRAQSLRFPISNWTESEARTWIKNKKIKILLFEPAKKSKSQSNTPANAGKNKQEVSMPTLKEFLAENPTAMVEYEKTMETKYNAGVEAGRKETREIIKRISPFLTSDTYDTAIRKTAVKALTGEINADAFITAVAIEDARAEQVNSKEAKKETEKIGDTPPQDHGTTGNDNGEIKTEADFQAEIKRAKAEMEVK